MTKIIIAVILMTALQTGFCKPFFKINKEKVKGGNNFTISQISSESNFDITKSVKLGKAQLAYTVFSQSGKYMAVFLIQKGKKDDDVIFFSTEDLKETSRVKVNKLINRVIGYGVFRSQAYFTENEDSVIIPIKTRKLTSLNSYNIETGQLNFSKVLPKKMAVIERIAGTNKIVAGRASGIFRYKILHVYDMLTGDLTIDLPNNKFSKNYTLDNANLIVNFKEKKSKVVKPYSLAIIDSKSGQTLLTKSLSTKPPVFSKKKIPTDKLYFVSYIKGEKGSLKLFKIEDDKIVLLSAISEKVTPKSLFFDKAEQHFIVVGKHDSTFFDLTKQQQSGVFDNPFDIATGFFSENGELVYLREGSGSEVGIFDFASKQMIKKSGTGRAGVKFGQFMASALLATAGAYYGGYVSIPVSYSDTAMITDRNEASLYVVNAKTNDVTIFDAKTLEGKTFAATGQGTFAVSRLKQEYYPNKIDGDVFVFGNKEINYFDQITNKVKKTIEYKSFQAVDYSQNIFYCLDKDNHLQLYRLSTGELLKTYKDEKSLVKIVNYIDVNY